VTEGTVEKHVRSTLGKLPSSANRDDHRGVLFLLTYLDAR
jgi:serine/threonine-protein kinase PknK